ncbi:MAG: Flp pilus assembly complex ATPase component TadA [Anaerolineaceae bacterium]|nr:Flp pilus assembly complex ATPase component TadA [Anaerolineaceae bacterium]
MVMNSSGADWNTGNIFAQSLTGENRRKIIEMTTDRLSDDLPFELMASPEKLSAAAKGTARTVVNELRLSITDKDLHDIVTKVVGQVAGFGYLYPLFQRDDISEILVNPNRTLWVMEKGSMDFTLVKGDISERETDRVVEALLRQSGRSLTEAVPTVSAKLARVDNSELPALRGGARIHIVHRCVCPAMNGTHSINIRMYEQEPVKPEKILKWNMAPEKVIHGMLNMVTNRARVMVFGGTASGKTTLLSALCDAIPKDKRVVKIEDPEEIWIDHPNVTTIEARSSSPGMSLQEITVAYGVDNAMRMSPSWLIVGEVRDGAACLGLLRGLMSDHSGLSTTHAESPEAAAYRLALLMEMDCHQEFSTSYTLIAEALDVFVQVGFDRDAGRRIIKGVWQIEKRVGENGEPVFLPLYLPGNSEIKPLARRRS